MKIEARGNDIPYSCDGRYYIRNVKSDDLMDNQTVRRAIVSGSYDALRETKAISQNLSFNYLKEYFISNGIHCRDGKEFLGNFGLLNSQNEYNMVAYLYPIRIIFRLKLSVLMERIKPLCLKERNMVGAAY